MNEWMRCALSVPDMQKLGLLSKSGYPIWPLWHNTRVGSKVMGQQFDISDRALFIGVQHLCTFSIVASLIYHILPNVWKASYTISASILLRLRLDRPYNMNKFISCVVPELSQFFHFGEEIVIAWIHIGWVGWVLWIFQNLPFPAAQEVLTAAVWLLALS